MTPMPVSRPLALTILLALLGGCSLGPDYARPDVATPAGWDSRSDAAGLWPDAEWWRQFGSSELDTLIAEAKTSSTDMRAAAARIRQAEAQAKIAGATLYPSLAAGGGAGRNWQDGNNGSGTRNSFSGDLTASYQVDLFGANSASAASALTSLEASRYDRETVAITLYSDIAATYFQLLSLRDRIRLSSETLRTVQDTLDLLVRQRQLGSSTEYEVAQQRSAVATQRGSLSALQQSERQTLDALAVLLGRNPQGFRVAAGTLDSLSLPPVAAGLPSELLLRRPDLRRAEADLRSANYDIAAARAARFPSLSIAASAGSAAASAGALFEPATMAYSIAAALTAPIFQGGRLQGQEELARARNDEIVENYRAAILSAFRDTEDALDATASTAEQFGYAREAFEQANEAYRIVQARYAAGTVDFLDLLVAQRTVFAANDTLVQAAFSRYAAIVDLYTALGGGWDGDMTETTASAD